MKKTALIFLMTLGWIAVSIAAKPVTLTDFHKTYNYLEEVQHVLNNGLIDGRVVAFLTDENNPVDQKAAIINTLVVNNKTKSNALTFKQYVSRKYKENWENLDLSKLNGDELFCLGYMTILDDNGNSTNGLPMLEKALEKKPESYTINLFYALAKAERLIVKGQECDAWKASNDVKTNNSLNNDMDSGIAEVIFRVMESYNKGCE